MKKLLFITGILLCTMQNMNGMFGNKATDTDNTSDINIIQDWGDPTQEIERRLNRSQHIVKSTEFTEKVRQLLIGKEYLLPVTGFTNKNNSNVAVPIRPDIKTAQIEFYGPPLSSELQISINKKLSNLFVVIENGEPVSIIYKTPKPN